MRTSSPPDAPAVTGSATTRTGTPWAGRRRWSGEDRAPRATSAAGRARPSWALSARERYAISRRPARAPTRPTPEAGWSRLPGRPTPAWTSCRAHTTPRDRTGAVGPAATRSELPRESTSTPAATRLPPARQAGGGEAGRRAGRSCWPSSSQTAMAGPVVLSRGPTTSSETAGGARRCGDTEPGPIHPEVCRCRSRAARPEPCAPRSEGGDACFTSRPGTMVVVHSTTTLRGSLTSRPTTAADSVRVVAVRA